MKVRQNFGGTSVSCPRTGVPPIRIVWLSGNYQGPQHHNNISHSLLPLFSVNTLSKAQELGTPLSASFEGFGADEHGCLSAEQLHKALKDIGQFRWTTVRDEPYVHV